MKRVAVLGYTGAIGSAIYHELLSDRNFETLGLNSKDFNLSERTLSIEKIDKVDVLVHCAGTFGGLRQYTNKESLASRYYLENLKLISNYLENSNAVAIINISSSSVANPQNFNSDSNYYEYVNLKKQVEDIFNNSNIKNILNIRPTNIISRFERVATSNHVIASLYRNVINNKDLNYVVWSHKDDWREFTEAQDLAKFVKRLISSQELSSDDSRRVAIHCSNGERIYIRDIVNEMSKLIKGCLPKDIIFSELHRKGPVPELLSSYLHGQEYIKFDTCFLASLKEFCDAQH